MPVHGSTSLWDLLKEHISDTLNFVFGGRTHVEFYLSVYSLENEANRIEVTEILPPRLSILAAGGQDPREIFELFKAMLKANKAAKSPFTPINLTQDRVEELSDDEESSLQKLFPQSSPKKGKQSPEEPMKGPAASPEAPPRFPRKVRKHRDGNDLSVLEEPRRLRNGKVMPNEPTTPADSRTIAKILARDFRAKDAASPRPSLSPKELKRMDEMHSSLKKAIDTGLLKPKADPDDDEDIDGNTDEITMDDYRRELKNMLKAPIEV